MLKRVLDEARHASRLRETSPEADTRERILEAGSDLFQRRGFNGFSYKHIAVLLGLRHAAIHYHFRNKSDLGLALLQRYRRIFLEWAEELESRVDDEWDRLQAYFGLYVDYQRSGSLICPSGVVSNDFDSLPEAMQEEARQLLRDRWNWLTRTLDNGRSAGKLNFPGRAAERALVIGAAMQGALQIDRVTSNNRMEQIIAQLELEMRRDVSDIDNGRSS